MNILHINLLGISYPSLLAKGSTNPPRQQSTCNPTSSSMRITINRYTIYMVLYTVHVYTYTYIDSIYIHMYTIYYIHVCLPISYLTAISDIYSTGSMTPWGKEGAEAYNSIVLGPIIFTISFKSI